MPRRPRHPVPNRCRPGPAVPVLPPTGTAAVGAPERPRPIHTTWINASRAMSGRRRGLARHPFCVNLVRRPSSTCGAQQSSQAWCCARSRWWPNAIHVGEPSTRRARPHDSSANGNGRALRPANRLGRRASPRPQTSLPPRGACPSPASRRSHRSSARPRRGSPASCARRHAHSCAPAW